MAGKAKPQVGFDHESAFKKLIGTNIEPEASAQAEAIEAAKDSAKTEAIIKTEESTRTKAIVKTKSSAETEKSAAKGRPKADRETKKRISLAVYPSDYDNLQKIAYITRKSVSDIVSKLIAAYVSDNAEILEKYEEVKSEYQI